MKNKTTKLLLSVGSLAAIVAPIATVVSCGTGGGFEGRVDTKNDGKVILRTSWSSTSNYYKALEELVTKYNEINDSIQGAMNITLEHVEGGYGDIANQTITKLNAGDKETLPNMFIDYASGLASMKAYEMEVDLQKLKMPRKVIDEESVIRNNDVAGMKAEKQMGSVPLAASTQMISIDKPLLKYLLGELEKIPKVSIISESGGIIEKIQNYSENNEDNKQIVKLWGEVTDSKLDEEFTINDNTFESYEGLFELGKNIMKAFGKDATGDKNLHLLGIDSPTTLVQNMAASLQGHDEYNALISKDPNQFVNNDWKNPGKAADNLQKTSEMISTAMNNGALWVGGGGAYSSNFFKEHRLAIAIGSTAGYNYGFNKHENILKIGDLIVQAPITAADSNEVFRFMNKSHKNKVFKSTSTIEKESLSYDYKSKTEEDDKILTSATYISFPEKEDEIPAGAEEIILEARTDEKRVFVWTTSQKPINISTDSSVNEEDLLIKPTVAMAALKEDAANPANKVVFAQGPGIVAVHANDAEDKAVELFLEWIYSTDPFEFTWYKTKESITPSLFFTKHSGYIVPIKGYVTTKKDNVKSALGKFGGPNISLEALSEVALSGPHFTNSPIDETTSPFRKNLDAVIGSMRDNAHIGNTIGSTEIYDRFLSDSGDWSN